eukprot:m51a1_g5987 hypothetical protein (256) ;mRNA; r:272011-273011
MSSPKTRVESVSARPLKRACIALRAGDIAAAREALEDADDAYEDRLKKLLASDRERANSEHERASLVLRIAEMEWSLSNVQRLLVTLASLGTASVTRGLLEAFVCSVRYAWAVVNRWSTLVEGEAPQARIQRALVGLRASACADVDRDIDAPYLQGLLRYYDKGKSSMPKLLPDMSSLPDEKQVLEVAGRAYQRLSKIVHMGKTSSTSMMVPILRPIEGMFDSHNVVVISALMLCQGFDVELADFSKSEVVAVAP